MNDGESGLHWTALIRRVELSKTPVNEALKLTYDIDLEAMRDGIAHWEECIAFEQRRRDVRESARMKLRCRSCGTLAVLSESCIKIKDKHKVLVCPSCGESNRLCVIGNKNEP